MCRLFNKTMGILTLALMLAAAGPAFAQQSKPALYMVSVGVSQYQFKKYEAGVAYAAKDATDVARLFKNQEGKLFSRVESRLLTDNQATLKNIEQAIDWATKKASANAYVVVFLAGHGGPNAIGQYSYVTHDAHPLLDSTRVQGQLLRDLLQASKGKRFLILDTCHSGGFSGSGCDFVTMAACMAKEFSSEKAEIRNGFFTHALVEALSGKADMNKDGAVTLAEMDAYVADRVQTLSKGKQQSTMHRPATMQSRLPVALVGQPAVTAATK